MDYNKLIALAKAKGISDLEIYLYTSEGFSCSLFKGEIDSYKVSEITTISLKGLYQNKMGNVSSENTNESNFEFLLDRLIENAKIMGDNLVEEIYEGSNHYETIKTPKDDFIEVSIEDKIKSLQLIEKLALNYDPRITTIQHLSYDERKTSIELFNSKGLNLKRDQQYGYYALSVVAKDKDSTKNKYDYIIKSSYQALNYGELIKKTCDEALKSLHPIKIMTKSYPLVLKNSVVASLLGAFERVFSADAAIKNMTPLKDKLNQVIAPAMVNIIDAPLLQDGLFPVAFDDEGVACYNKKLVDKGVFKLFLNNLKTARKLNVLPTGNGFKPSPTSTVDISSHNLHLENGTSSWDELVKSLNEGIIITEISGLHSGVNLNSGDFSLQSQGFYVKDGYIVHPVALIVISGNFFKMLSEIELMANDLEFNSSSFGSPSIKVRSISVSN